MDPQVRVLLETAYEAFEDAGIAPGRASDTVGVYVGTSYGDYWLRQVWDLDDLDFYTEIGTSRGALSGRVSYSLDLTGPTLTVDSACSSSLVTVRMACQALLAGDCDVALAGGSNLALTPYNWVTFNQAGAHSPDGLCKFGDAKADGYVRCEAAGWVVLEPLARALANGDRIRAVILGGASTSNGFSGEGMAAPSVTGQVKTLRRAYAEAGIDPATVDFVEAHGTGTTAGDRVELTALATVVGMRAATQPPCRVGTVKANIGHAEGAAGIIGFIKAILALEHRALPACLHLTELNPAIDWDTTRLELPRTSVALASHGRLIAGVSSMGASGSNAHVVLSSPPARKSPQPLSTPRAEVLVLSARNRIALHQLRTEYESLLRTDESEARLAQICAGVARGRRHLEHRLAVVADSAPQVADALSVSEGDSSATAPCFERTVTSRPRVVFVFPGQGSQWAHMGQELLSESEEFREALTACDAVVREHTGWSVLEAIRGTAHDWVQDTHLVQPALWAIGVSLARTWQLWGITPDAVIGQSQGEVAAAHIAGALSLEESGRLSCLRARLATNLCPPGAMARVEAGVDRTRELLARWGINAEIAVVNSPTSTVLSATPAAVDEFAECCAGIGLDCMKIPVDYAAHSAMVDPVREPLLREIETLTPGRVNIAMMSTVDAAILDGTDLGPEYWWRNLREPVQLEPAIRSLLAAGPTIFLHMSPHPILATAIEETAAVAEVSATALASLRRGQPDRAIMLTTLAELYVSGCEIDWATVYGDTDRAFDLPHYPWQHVSVWHQAPSCPWPPLGGGAPATSEDLNFSSHQQLSSAPPATATTGTEIPAPVPTQRTDAEDDPSPHPLLGVAHTESDGGIEWLNPLTAARHGYLRDHRISDHSVMPGAAYLELALAAARHGRAGYPLEVCEVEFVALLPLDEFDTGGILLRTRTDATRERLTIDSRDGVEWITHARAAIRDPADPTPEAESLAAAERRCVSHRSVEEFYRAHAEHGNNWSGAFRGIVELWTGPDAALARIEHQPDGRHLFHPAVLDTCLQTALAIGPVTDNGDSRGLVLSGVDRVRLNRPVGPGSLWCYARWDSARSDAVHADISVFDDTGALVAVLAGVRGRRLHAAAHAAASSDTWFYQLRWRPVPAEQPSSTEPGWLVVGRGAEATGLARQLRATGSDVAQISSYSESAEVAAAVRQLAHGGQLAGVVDFSAVTTRTTNEAGADEIHSVGTELCDGIRCRAAALRDIAGHPAPRLIAVTRGAQGAQVTAPWQSVVWGFLPVCGHEHGLRSYLVDLDPDDIDRDAESEFLAALVLSPMNENRLARRENQWHAPRLEEAEHQPGESGTGPIYPDRNRRLWSDGGADRLELIDCPRPAPSEGEVEIAVSHTGVNFHDLLIVVDGVREDDPFGGECAGTVSRIGAGVRTVAVGDRVLAYAPGAHREHVLVDERTVVLQPSALTAGEAAGVAVTYTTAYYALVERGGLRAGERVLIHSATGGFGLAALHLARRLGAVVYATAGTEAKRDLLIRLGAAKVADSRSTEFARQFRESADPLRGGVDLILNTLIGDGITANLAVLNPYGRYLDLTLTADSSAHLPLAALGHNRTYAHTRLHDLYSDDPAHLGRLLHAVTGMITRGELPAPLHRVLPVEQAHSAFATMLRSEHIGKLVLKFPGSATTAPRRQPTSTVALRPDAIYLLTGGLGGIGGVCARWLLDRGCRSLVLTGRTPLDPDATDDPRAELLARLRSGGATVEYAAVDVADETAMTELVLRLRRSAPIAGVIHAAGVLTPTSSLDATTEEIGHTLRPKVAGGWVLHRLFTDTPPDFFVLFSSASVILAGTDAAHQLSAYTAGNEFLDALAAHRRGSNLPATVVDWGYWREVGMAARLSVAADHDVRPTGMAAIHPDAAYPLFDAMLTGGDRMICLPTDWTAFQAAYPGDATAPILRDVSTRTTDSTSDSHSTTTGGASAFPTGTSLPTEPTPTACPEEPLADETELSNGNRSINWSVDPRRPDATPVPPRRAESPHNGAESTENELEEYLAEQVARVLGSPVAQLDREMPLHRLGMDSLMAADIRNRLRRDRGHDLTVAQVLDAESVRKLARTLALS
ncbi:acyl transferase domain-containing protein [Nocardia pseudobrasiliensis]|uniref:Acyl transferase domain-containing protein n=2 Tax=Nocardia pseudobrasiliensis TaxID=45979 RepID=A0A370HK32_9NOCA|nr:acyl transferase domain-containing protein [Nocardia pseudobrasiliensis]